MSVSVVVFVVVGDFGGGSEVSAGSSCPWVPGGCSSMVGGEGCFPFEGFAWRSFRFGRLRFGMAVE